MYTTLVAGHAPVPLPQAGSYDDYCVRQERELSVLTLESPPVSAWVDFFEKNNGTLPEFRLPLGDRPVTCDMMSVSIAGRATDGPVRIRVPGGGRPLQRRRLRLRRPRRT